VPIPTQSGALPRNTVWCPAHGNSLGPCPWTAGWSLVDHVVELVVEVSHHDALEGTDLAALATRLPVTWLADATQLGALFLLHELPALHVADHGRPAWVSAALGILVRTLLRAVGSHAARSTLTPAVARLLGAALARSLALAIGSL